MGNRMGGSKRGEDYLKAMLILEREKGYIRITDLAHRLKVKPASVVEYLEKLAMKGFVEYEKRERIKLTEKGRKLAEKIYRRHIAIRDFLKKILMIPEDIAEKDACYIEHGLSNETMDRVVQFLEFLDKCFKEKPKFLEHLKYYYEYNRCSEKP
ncbi:MAG TPA: metal-dependent transcriptional regulator [Thermoproteales archaeon]|nr:metal-dependent transcriptional regulator [Thermoproteales archaeon]